MAGIATPRKYKNKKIKRAQKTNVQTEDRSRAIIPALKTRINSLNSVQYRKGEEMEQCKECVTLIKILIAIFYIPP